MKKAIIIFVCFAILGAEVFALEKAAGMGALGGVTFQSGEEGTYADGSFTRFSGGIFGFFGFSQYTELNLSLLYKAISGGNGGSSYFTPTWALQVGVYGKYPFVLSDKIVLFPTAGLDFEWSFDMDTWWSDLWIRAGLGMDLFFSETMFLRSHLIYGAAIPVTYVEDLGVKVGHGLLVKVGLGWMF